jgi:hypothetical protein
MAAEVIMAGSADGEVVLNPFLGDGTTLIAAEQVGRITATLFTGERQGIERTYRFVLFRNPIFR